MMDHTDPFDSDTSTHEASIRATLESDLLHKNLYGSVFGDGSDDKGASGHIYIARGVSGGAHARYNRIHGLHGYQHH